MEKIIKEYIKASIDVKTKLLNSPEVIKSIKDVVQAIKECFEKGGKLLVFGNGGSASDAQHMVAEFVARFKKERKALPAIALTTNTSTITALANDYTYDIVFKRQIEAFADSNDVVLGISTSGTAKSVIEGLKQARSQNAKTIALTGKDGGELPKVSDISIIVPSDITACIQESHIMIIHLICEIVEANY
ncbi:MAG: D-sedoheptulose 7-phosphate isomerase [Candidatus Omnitrophica bacterium]|nr:D-sedoheptulose 7-phosphate isomerase [Candidatus Omnitrophota bacterium]